MNKERREKLAALSFTEKIKLLEKLRARSLALAESRKQLRTGLQDGRPAPSSSPEKR